MKHNNKIRHISQIKTAINKRLHVQRRNKTTETYGKQYIKRRDRTTTQQHMKHFELTSETSRHDIDLTTYPYIR